MSFNVPKLKNIVDELHDFRLYLELALHSLASHWAFSCHGFLTDVGPMNAVARVPVALTPPDDACVDARVRGFAVVEYVDRRALSFHRATALR